MPLLSAHHPRIREIEESFYRLAETCPEPIQDGEADLPAHYTSLQLAGLDELTSQLEFRQDSLTLAVPPAGVSLGDAIKRFCKKIVATAFRWLMIRQVEFNAVVLRQTRESARLLELAATDLDELLSSLKVHSNSLKVQKAQIHYLLQRVLRLEMQQMLRGHSVNRELWQDGPEPDSRAATNLRALIDTLLPYSRIIVTGPQRSGTTIAAAILARELGYEFLPEEAFGVDNLQEFFRLYDHRDRFVIQAPCLCSLAHALPGCVVLVRRDIEEIIRSQKRVKWVFESLELQNYFRDESQIARVRYEAWDRYQKPRMAHAYELAYDSLRGHPLWVEAQERTQFHARQIVPSP